MTYFLSPAEVAGLGLAGFGSNVAIDRDARLMNPGRIQLGHNVRIDAQAILSPGRDGISIGNHVHISVGACLYGGGGAITLHDYCTISARVLIYTMSDLPGTPKSWCLPDDLKFVERGPVTVHPHVGVGAGAIILPGVEIGFGASVGPLTLVRRDVPELRSVYGNPARLSGNQYDRAVLEQQMREIVLRFPHLDSPPRGTPADDNRG